MANKFHNTQVPFSQEPKNSNRGKGKDMNNPRPKFTATHKAGDLIKYPKNIGGSIREKYSALDVLD